MVKPEDAGTRMKGGEEAVTEVCCGGVLGNAISKIGETRCSGSAAGQQEKTAQ